MEMFLTVQLNALKTLIAAAEDSHISYLNTSDMRVLIIFRSNSLYEQHKQHL